MSTVSAATTIKVKIPHFLLEAYMGYHEESVGIKFWNEGTFQKDLYEDWCKLKIMNDLPEEHLRIYLEWVGIHGYTQIIFNLANGQWYMG